jgi:hypothetical protein
LAKIQDINITGPGAWAFFYLATFDIHAERKDETSIGCSTTTLDKLQGGALVGKRFCHSFSFPWNSRSESSSRNFHASFSPWVNLGLDAPSTFILWFRKER